jgi:FMN reductase
MRILVIAGSVAGNKTRLVTEYASQKLTDQYPDHQVTFINLADYNLAMSDGRNYLDYSGDAGKVTKEIMESNVIVLGSPIFQASIPGALKNLLDLLPTDGLRDKVVGLIITAGSQRHNLVPEYQFKPILHYLKAQVLDTYVFIEDRDFQGNAIANDDVYFRIDRMINDLLTLALVYNKVREQQDAKYGF